MPIITLPNVLSKLRTLSQEGLALLYSYIKENATPIASANGLVLFHSLKTSGDLTAATYYEITDNSGGADFTTVGASVNTIGTQFKANLTNLTPTWGFGELAEASWSGNTISISGTTTINTISKKFLNYGDRIRLIFSVALQLTDSNGTSGDDCEMVLGANLTTSAGDEIELQLRSDSKFYPVGGTIAGGGGASFWENSGTFTSLITANQIRLAKMIQEKQSTDIASANNVIFPSAGNAVVFSNSVNEIQTFADIDTDGKAIQGGTTIKIDVKEGQIIRHLFGSSGNNKQIRADANQTWEASQDMTVFVWYDSVREFWILIGTSQGDILANAINFDAVPITLNGYSLAAVGTITGWAVDELLNHIVTNEGTATVSINSNNDGIDIGIGTFFGVKTFDASLVQINEIVGCENQTALPYLHCGITGNAFLVSEVKTVITQDTYMYVQRYGSVNMTLSGGYEITIPLKTDLTKIYN